MIVRTQPFEPLGEGDILGWVLAHRLALDRPRRQDAAPAEKQAEKEA
jgi:hypothetical protein